MVIPLADFLYSDVYDRLMGSVQRGVYLGIHDVAGIPCHHLSFQQETIDWQLWIDAGPQPLPRKLVIAYKTEDDVPQYEVTIRKWNLAADVPDALFRVPAASRAQEGGAARALRRRGRSRRRRRGRTAAGDEDRSRRRSRRRSHEAPGHGRSCVASSSCSARPRRFSPRATRRWRRARVGVRGVERRLRRQQLLAGPQRKRLRLALGHARRAAATTSTGRPRPRAAPPTRSTRASNTSGGQVQSVNRTSTATNASGQSANRDRTTTNEGGYASVQGNASTSTGREASGQGAVGKNAYGQTVADRKRQHEVQRLLRRRGEAEPERHLEHGHRRAQRREGHADPAVRLQDDDLRRHALLRLCRRLLPALHLLRRAVLLPGSAALLLPVPLRAGGSRSS